MKMNLKILTNLYHSAIINSYIAQSHTIYLEDEFVAKFEFILMSMFSLH